MRGIPPMDSDVPALAMLEPLVTSPDIRDRAFAASALSLRPAGERAEVAVLYERIRETARATHAEVRRRIQEGTLDTGTFIAGLREAPLEIRDHLVEEILDVAYPPLDEVSLPREVIQYSPSGISEILFMLENTDLHTDKTFVDLGAGLGKVVLLVALLTGARAYGVELDPLLVAHARASADALHLDAHFIEGDIREAPLPAADVYYMYIPLIRSADVAARLAAFASERKIQLFSQPLNLREFPWLDARNVRSYWLEKYEST